MPLQQAGQVKSSAVGFVQCGIYSDRLLLGFGKVPYDSIHIHSSDTVYMQLQWLYFDWLKTFHW